jgi:8-oxo-dGTP diphosphatase
MAYTYKYPRPMATVDILLWRFQEENPEFLLIRRRNPPYQGQWAMPGGFVEMNENLVESAERELEEETGISGVPLSPLLSAGDVGRDPRGRTITIVYTGILSRPFPGELAGDDASDAEWFAFSKLPPLAFDHEKLLSEALSELKFNSLWRLWILLFLPERFDLMNLNQACEIILGNEKFGKSVLSIAKKINWVKEIAPAQYERVADVEMIMESKTDFLNLYWLDIMK